MRAHSSLIFKGQVSYPTWLSDGVHIACYISSGAVKINTQTLTITETAAPTSPILNVSPDGTRCAFYNSKKEICIANLDGSGEVKLIEAQKSFGDILWISVEKGQLEYSVADSFAANWDAGEFLVFLIVYCFPILLVIFLAYWFFDKRRLRKLAQAKDIKYP
jgi:hypothetical protein